jgi:hypothetical protein
MKAIKKERNPKVTVKKIKVTLTKAQMIASIQQREAAMFLELKEAERDYGTESNLTQQLRSHWASVNRLMESLGIANDFTLPDNVKAAAIITERIAKAQA